VLLFILIPLIYSDLKMDMNDKKKIVLAIVVVLVLLYMFGVFDSNEEEVVASVAVEVQPGVVVPGEVVVPPRSKPASVSSVGNGNIVVIDGKNWKHWSKHSCGGHTGKGSFLNVATLEECAAECIKRGSGNCTGFKMGRGYLKSPYTTRCYMKPNCSSKLKSGTTYDSYHLP